MKTSILSAVFLSFLLNISPASGYERVVVLYGAISPVLVELGVENLVVGSTKSDDIFLNTPKVGSHLKPNIELIKALKPDLILAGSIRAYPPALKEKIPVKTFYYDPGTLEDVLNKITELGQIFKKDKEAQAVVLKLKNKLTALRPLTKKVTVVYEVSQSPLKVAGKKSIIASIIEAAGGVNLIEIDKKHVLLSPEQVIALNPDYYIYQEGPMNKNPQPPLDRDYFKPLKSRILTVEEIEFARPGMNVFDAAVKLNKLFEK
jgi:iron complex transport system substrate-binding protein